MQFQVLISFFFAYIAAVQASPVQLPNTPTEAISTIQLPNVPRDIPIAGGVVSSVHNVVTGAIPSVHNALTGAVGSIPVEVPDVAGLASLEDLALPIPVRRDVTEILDNAPLPVPRDVSKSVKDASLKVHNTLPAFSKRQDDGTISGLVAPVKGAIDPLVDTAMYEASPIVGTVKQLAQRQLAPEVPTVSSTEGVVSEVKVPEVPTIPEVPSVPNGVPAVPVSRREIEVPQVSTPKMVRVHRRQATGCAQSVSRRSLDTVPTTPDVLDVATPSTPSIPTMF